MNEPPSTVLDLQQVKTRTVDQSSEYKGTLMLCGTCKKTISLEPGDLIFGGQWYHLACSKEAGGSGLHSDTAVQDELLNEHRAQLKM